MARASFESDRVSRLASVRCPHDNATQGEVAEWSNAAVLKTVVRLRGPGVRIPPSPPYTNHIIIYNQQVTVMGSYISHVVSHVESETAGDDTRPLHTFAAAQRVDEF